MEIKTDTCKKLAESMACDMTGRLTVGADSISTGISNGRAPKADVQSVVAGMFGMTTGVWSGSHMCGGWFQWIECFSQDNCNWSWWCSSLYTLSQMNCC